MKTRHSIGMLSLCLLLAPLSSLAQEEKAPLQLGDFDTQGSVSLGYRFTEFKGREQKFLELFDLQKGFRLADFSLVGQAKEGAVPFADSYSLTMSGLGGDPYPGGQLTLRKNKLYDLRVSYRQSYYYWDRNDDAILPTGLHGLTTNHNWATVRRFGSVNLTLPATNNLRFNFDYTRSGRDGVNFTTRALDYFGSPALWGSFTRADPYYVEAPLNEVANRLTGGVSYRRQDWNFHYRLGYQTFEQSLAWNNTFSPERSINVDASATANELLTNASWSEFRRLKTPVSEFSYNGSLAHRLSVRGGYLFYRYRGPASMDAAFNGMARTNSAGTTDAPYAVSMNSRVQVTEPNHVIDQGFTYKVRDWWNVHADYRYSRFTADSRGMFHSLRDTTPFNDETEVVWRNGVHEVDLSLEFIPARNLVVRPGVRFLKRDVESLADGVIDDVHTRRIKAAWPIASVYYQPSKIFSVRADIQSISSGSYTRISPHTDVGSRYVIHFRPTEKLSVEDNFIIRNRRLRDTDFENKVRSNAATISYAVSDRLSAYCGFSYDSFFATASVTFIRGVPPLTTTWRDQTVNRVWQAGIGAKPYRHLGVNLTGNFLRSTGVGEISGEPPNFGPLTWPLVTGTIYYDFRRIGRLSVDLQRTYYLEEIVRGNDFRANLLTLRWTRDF